MSDLDRRLRARDKIISDLRTTVARLTRDERGAAELLAVEAPLSKNSQAHFQRIIRQLQTELEERVAQLNDSEDTCKDLQAENRLLGRLVDDLRSERQQLIERAGEADGLREQLGGSEELHRALDAATSESAAIQRRLQQKHEYTGRLEARVTVLERENKTLREAMEMGGGEALAVAGVAEGLEVEKTARLGAEERVRELAAELRTVRLDHATQRQHQSSRDQRVADLTADVGALHDRLASTEARNAANDAEIRALRMDRRDLEARVVEVQGHATDSAERAASLSMSNSRLASQARQASESIMALESMVADVRMQARLDSAQREQRELAGGRLEESDHRLLDALRRGVQQLRGELMAEYAASDRLQRRCTALEEALREAESAASDSRDRATCCESALAQELRRVGVLEASRLKDLTAIQRLEDRLHAVESTCE